MVRVMTLSGGLVVLGGNLRAPTQLSGDDREQMRFRAENVGSVRSALLAEGTPLLNAFHVTQENVPQAIPLVTEMEKTVQLMKEVLTGSQSLGVFAPQPSSDDPQPSFFVRDAFTNVKHIQLPVKGCLTSGLCDVLYNGVDWPGITPPAPPFSPRALPP